MNRFLHGLGRRCARHHRVVLVLWALLAVGSVVAAGAAGERNSDNLSLPGTGSTRAADLLEESLPGQVNGSNPVVLEAASGKLSDSDNARVVQRTVDSLKAEPDVRSAVSPLSKEGAGQLSKDGRIGYISVTLREGPADLTDAEAEAVSDAADPARDAGMEVAIGGYLGQALSEANTDSSEAIGLLAAVVILLFAFGTVTAMLLPIVTAIVGLVTALSLIQLLGHVVEVPSVAPTLATMIGLGVGIDYALFVVTRHKLQLRDGLEIRASIARATSTAGGAVVFAGLTVVIALCSMAASGIPFVGAMGYAAAVSVLVAIVAAVTLLPALLGLLDRRIDSLRVKLGRTHPDDHQPHGWARWARGVAARPWRSVVAGVVVLGVLALPVLDLELGSTDASELPGDTTARQAYDLIAEGFGPGANGPLLIAARTGSPAALQEDVARTRGVVAVTPPVVKGDVSVFTAVPSAAPSSDATENLVRRLRDDVIPRSGVTAYVGGQTAGYIDLADRISDRLPRMILIVVALSFVVLMVAFRSLLLPVKAAAANLLSVAAAYGVVTFVFQEGHGATLLGLDGAVPIASFVPLLMFAILFGLSMDYEVFLLSQIQEHWEESRDTRRAVVDGLASTGRVITSAALIMFCVFSSFVLSGDAVVKQFGVGLAVAIAIDATVVRCLLVPAVMTLLGDSCWWLPRWLGRALPRIEIEGGPAARQVGAE